jgi:hypothetical protein
MPPSTDQARSDVHVDWRAEPEEHDYPAAGAYLTMLAAAALVDRLIAALRAAPTTHQKAKDILPPPVCGCSTRTTRMSQRTSTGSGTASLCHLCCSFAAT